MVVFCSISVTLSMLQRKKKKKFKWKADTTLTLQIPITSKLNQSVILKQYHKIDIVLLACIQISRQHSRKATN